MVAIGVAITTPAQAQWCGNDSYRRQRPQRSGGGFFENLFGPSRAAAAISEAMTRRAAPRQQPSDNSRAPPPRKPDAKSEPVPPTTSIVVMGDGMADWLAYGLEDAFADAPEIGILRKNKPHSGLLRYDAKGDLDWWHEARDILAQEKPNYIVMMLGVGRPPGHPRTRPRQGSGPTAKEAEGKERGRQGGAAVRPRRPDEQPRRRARAAARQEGQRRRRIPQRGVGEDLHRRIDETIAALKSEGRAGVLGRAAVDPRHQVDRGRGLSQRISTARAPRRPASSTSTCGTASSMKTASSRNFGPDYEGQNRRLRSATASISPNTARASSRITSSGNCAAT